MTSLTTTVQERISHSPPARNMPGQGTPSGPPTAGDVLAMLRRRSVLAVSLALLFSAMFGGGFAAWWVYFPGYRGEALIECVSNIPDPGLSVEQQRLKQDEHERFVMTQALLMKSAGILGEALKVTAVRQTDWFRSLAPDKHLLELTDELIAAPVRGTNFLRVAMECRNPSDPAILVNEVVTQWLQSVKQRSADEFASEALDASQRELDDIEAEILQVRAQLKAIGERLPAGAIENPGNNITHQQMQQYNEQVTGLQLELAQLDQYRTVYNDPQGVAVTAEDRAAVELDPQVAEMSRAVFFLEQRRAADAMVYGSSHGIIKQLDAQIAAAETKLAEARAERLAERRADLREATNTAYNNTRHALFLAQEHLLKADAALQDQGRAVFEYENLQQDIEQKLEYREELAQYVASLTRIKNQRTAIKVNVAQAATDPLRRSTPNVLLLPVGFFLAVLLSVGVSLGLELLDTSVRTSQDIIRHLDLPLLGLVPHTDDEEVDIGRVETGLRDAPRSMIAEAFRHIRTNLQFAAPAERQRRILITSARPEDGKTTVVSNLGMAIAQGGRRVLLVDANFRRPVLTDLLGEAGGRGLSNLLIGDGSLDDCVIATDVPGLSILGTGPAPPNPAELLGSANCRALLEEALSRYEQVLIDTPPVLLTSDALSLASAVDGAILVVRAARNSRGVARRASGLLADVGCRAFGVVLNAAQVARGGYFREQLRDYYNYQEATPASGKRLPGPDDPSSPAST